MRFDIACSLRCLFHCSRRPGQFPGKMISCRLLVVVPAGHIVAMFLQATWYTIYRVKSVSECCVETSISYRQVKASGKKKRNARPKWTSCGTTRPLADGRRTKDEIRKEL